MFTTIQELKNLLISSFGLDTDATDAAACACLATLSSEHLREVREIAGNSIVDAALNAEDRRVSMLRKIGSNMPGVRGEDIDTSIRKGHSLTEAREAFLSATERTHRPVGGTFGSVEVGEDGNVESLRQAIPQALAMRWCGDAGMTVEKLQKFEEREKRDRPAARFGANRKAYLGRVHERANELKHLPLKEMFRLYLASLGANDIFRANDNDLSALLSRKNLNEAFPRMAMLAESTSDFPSIHAGCCQQISAILLSRCAGHLEQVGATGYESGPALSQPS